MTWYYYQIDMSSQFYHKSANYPLDFSSTGKKLPSEGISDPPSLQEPGTETQKILYNIFNTTYLWAEH